MVVLGGSAGGTEMRLLAIVNFFEKFVFFFLFVERSERVFDCVLDEAT